MLQQPRKIKSLVKQRRRPYTSLFCITPSRPFVFCLLRPTKISWRHFETIRLKIVRTLAKKRRSSKKTMFKQAAARQTKSRSMSTAVQRTFKPTILYFGFPHQPYSIKTKGSRMGKGKGKCKFWFFLGRPGTRLLSIPSSNCLAFQLIRHKLTALIPAITCKQYCQLNPLWTIDFLNFIISAHPYGLQRVLAYMPATTLNSEPELSVTSACVVTNFIAAVLSSLLAVCY